MRLPGFLFGMLTFIKRSSFVAPCPAISWNHLAYRSLPICGLMFTNCLKQVTLCYYQHLLLHPCSPLLSGTQQAPHPPCNLISIFPTQQDHCGLEGVSRQKAILPGLLLSEFFFSHAPFLFKNFDICLSRSKIEY